MLGDRSTPEASSHYHAENGEYDSPEKAKENGPVNLVEVNYYCPYCSAPNTKRYELPTAGLLEPECDNCGYTIELFRGTPIEMEHPVESYETVPDKIEELRDIRLDGEREDSVTYDEFANRRFTGFILGVLSALPLLMLTGWLIIAFDGPTGFFMLTSALAGLLGAMGYLFGRYRGLDTDYGWWSSTFDSHVDLYRRGLKRQDDQEELETPMHPVVKQEDEPTEE